MPRQEEIEEVAHRFSLLGEPNRLHIVLACLDRALPVGEIAGRVGISPSLASHHLRHLRAGRLLRAERDGRTVRYALDDEHVRDVVRTMLAHVCEPHEHGTGVAVPEP